MTNELGARLQSCVDRYGRSLQNPNNLISLHPRGKGRPRSEYSALSAPVVLTAASAFEGFAEDFLATALYLQGYTFSHIAHRSDLSNPTLRDWVKAIQRDFSGISGKLGKGFSVNIYAPPLPNATNGWWNQATLTWSEALDAAESWMQVRHCLTHGLVTGVRPEIWPGPRGGGPNDASAVLRQTSSGKHSLGIHGAISCIRIYTSGARHIADAIATSLGETLDWNPLPNFEKH